MDLTHDSSGTAASARQRWAQQTMAILDGMTPEHSSVLRAIYFDHQTVREVAAAALEPERRIARRAAVAVQMFAEASLSIG